MAETVFCLDIHQDRAAAVSVDINASTTVIKGFGADNYGESSFSETIENIKKQSSFISGSSRIAFGAELFSYRALSLPFTDKGKISQILPFELADLCPVDINTLAIDFLVTRKTDDGTEILTAMISKALLADYLDALNAAGIDPETIGISGVEEALLLATNEASDFAVIDIGPGWATIIMVADGSIALIRSIATPRENFTTLSKKRMELALSIKQTLMLSGLLDTAKGQYPVYLSGGISLCEGLAETIRSNLEGTVVKTCRQSARPSIKMSPEIAADYIPEEMDRALALAFRFTGKHTTFNFRKGEFKKRRSFSDYRSYFITFAVPALIILISALVYWGYTYTSLQKQQQELKNQIAEVFTATLPKVTRIINPVHQLMAKNRENKETYMPIGLSGTELTIVELLAELSTRIPPTYKVTVVRMVADMETIRLKAVTEDFNTVDNVQKELEKSPFFKSVSISSANQSAKGDKVNFELKIQRKIQQEI